MRHFSLKNSKTEGYYPVGFWYSERNVEGHSHCCVISGVMALSQTYDHLCLPLTACWSCQPLLERIQSAECQVRGLHLSPSALVFLRPSHKYSMVLRYGLAYMPCCVVGAYFVRIVYFRYHRVSGPFPEKNLKKISEQVNLYDLLVYTTCYD